jgi:hypothetical protein
VTPEDREEDRQPEDAGAYLGNQQEMASDTIPGGVQPEDEQVAGEATQRTGPGGRAENPDEGWHDGPEGHRQGRSADDDLIQRKG